MSNYRKIWLTSRQVSNLIKTCAEHNKYVTRVMANWRANNHVVYKKCELSGEIWYNLETVAQAINYMHRNGRNSRIVTMGIFENRLKNLEFIGVKNVI